MDPHIELEDAESNGDTHPPPIYVEIPRGGIPQNTTVVNVTIGRPRRTLRDTAKCVFWLTFMILGVIGLAIYLAYTFTR